MGSVSYKRVRTNGKKMRAVWCTWGSIDPPLTSIETSQNIKGRSATILKYLTSVGRRCIDRSRRRQSELLGTRSRWESIPIHWRLPSPFVSRRRRISFSSGRRLKIKRIKEENFNLLIYIYIKRRSMRNLNSRRGRLFSGKFLWINPRQKVLDDKVEFRVVKKADRI